MNKQLLYLLVLILFSVAITAQNNLADPAFGNNGIVHNSLGTPSRDVVFSAVRLPDGNTILAGSTQNGFDLSSVFLAKISTSTNMGSSVFNSSFGSAGKIKLVNSTSSNQSAREIKVRPDGKILVAINTGYGY
ncbi:MAG TPA: hypothetical protein VGB50_02200 [Flavobacterium sp.]